MEWIKISENQPEDFEFVLLLFKWHENIQPVVTTGFRRTDGEGAAWFDYQDEGQIYPTHWAPYPEVPNGVE